MKRTTRRAAESKGKPKEAEPPMTKAEAAKNSLSHLCLDPNRPPEVRAKVLLDVLHGHEPVFQQALLSDLLRKSSALPDGAEAVRLKECYEQALAELEHGPVRPATFVGPAEGELPGPGPRAHVVTPDGQERCPVVHPRVNLADIDPGMTLYLDAKGSIVLGAARTYPRAGQEGAFLRLVEGTGLVEAQLQNERVLLHAAAPVLEAVWAGKVRTGDRLLVCPRRHFALGVVPVEPQRKHRFVDHSRVPDVVAERDVGSPHSVLERLVRRLRVLLFRPDLLQRFDLRPRFAALLTGPTGCGKTLTIRAFLREFSRLLAERTGRTDLGSRVVRVKAAELLSEWLGRSDKNVEELFDDIQSVAAAEVETAKGEKVRLPVVVILEEVEGLARRRGSSDAAVYDRILAGLLQRLDDPTEDLGKLPLILLSTSNRPDLLDAAMCRRLGWHARFGRLDRDGLAAVLEKKLKPAYPYAAGQDRAELIARVTKWLFGPGGESKGVVEVTLRDGRKLVKRRRDFLTGGVVEQAVAGAIDAAVAAAEAGQNETTLTAEGLIEALREHIDGLADVLSADNAADYLDLPVNARVAGVRRLGGAGGPLPPLLTDLESN